MADATSRARRALLNVALAVATLGAVLGLGECGLRIAAAGDEPRARQPLPKQWQGLPELVGTQELVRRNVRGIRNGMLFETNRAGLRGPLRPHKKPRGVFRIVLIGDSFSMGEGVLYPETYGALLERRLGAERPETKFELINVGVSGLNTTGVANRFANVGINYQPDLVIYGYTVNDIEGPGYRRSVEERYTNPFYDRDAPLYLVRYLAPRWRMLTELLASPRGSYSYELDDNYFRNEPLFRAVQEGLERIARLAERRQACTALLVHTQLWALNALHPFRRHYAAVSAAAEARGFLAIESFPHFTRLLPRDGQDYWIHFNDSHPNAEGHRVLADALDDGLERLPAECWQPSERSRRGPRR